MNINTELKELYSKNHRTLMKYFEEDTHKEKNSHNVGL
jgi:hypothetical protein